jgi:hydroxymethylpyrimidine pyrophosphatase-like HAD family hydrolase
MKPYLKPARISLMLADVDGALMTNDKIVTARARAAVAALRAAKIAFTITSGRPPRGMKMLIDDLKIDTIVAGFNGGVFVNPGLSMIQSRFISRAAAAHALEVIEPAQTHRVALYRDRLVCARSSGSARGARSLDREIRSQSLDRFQPALGRRGQNRWCKRRPRRDRLV